MKKLVLLGVASSLLIGAPAYAQLVIQPTIVEQAPVAVAPYPYAPAPIVVGAPVYPNRFNRHHRYDWKYWQDHKGPDHR